MSRKISAKQLEKMIERGAVVRKRSVPAPEPEPNPEASTPTGHKTGHRGLMQVTSAEGNTDTPRITAELDNNSSSIMASINRLVDIMTSYILRDHQATKPVRLDINRDEFGFIESIDIVRGKDHSERQN